MKGLTTRRIVAVVLVATVVAELVLRGTGIHRIPLFRSDQRYEYFTLPDQVLRLGAVRFATNALGMRNGPIGPKKGRRVLVIGDSVINGGFTVDRDSMATERANAKARAEGRNVEFLNLGANSWGPDNAAAYLSAYGTFDADLIVGVWNSDDHSDRMGFEPVVGHNPYFRGRQRITAWGHAWDEFLIRTGQAGTFPEGPSGFNTGWYSLRDIAAQAGIPFTVVLHPRLSERQAGMWTEQGMALNDSLAGWDVPTANTFNALEDGHYADDIHLSVAGQATLAQFLAGHIEEAFAVAAE